VDLSSRTLRQPKILLHFCFCYFLRPVFV
jgi:hypothetical protein